MSFKSILLSNLAKRQTATPYQPPPPCIPDETPSPPLPASSTFRTIPSFYHPLPTATDSFGQKLREEARTLFLQKRSRELLDNTELKALWLLLDNAYHEQHQQPAPTSESGSPSNSVPPPIAAATSNSNKFIGYDAYQSVQRAVSPKCRRFLTSAVYARLQSVSPAALCGRVSILALFNYVMRKVWLQQTRIGLSLYDYSGQGYLREPNLEAYIMELIPTLPQLEGLERSFHSFYVCTAVRKFFFFLDPLGLGRIRIRDILACSFLDDLLELRDDEAPKSAHAEINWFSAPSALSVYGHYLNLDRDHNGMLSQQELAGYGSGTLTAVFLERVFAECHTYNGEMDYKTYLDFVLALENRSEPQSMHYLFRILDFEHCGYLTAFSLNYFFKGIEAQIAAHRAEHVNFEDVKDEIFDMVKPADPARITLKDLLRR